MIPSALVAQLSQGVADFLRVSFWSSTPGMDRVVEDLVATPDALWKGPYISVGLPFVAGGGGEPFPEVPLGFPAHRHQEIAFQRLSAGQSTVVATGTGSGKTESFLWPVLEHCRRAAGQPGVKAILIYPMNALATDQALRIARSIHRTRSLSGRVRAGLYIGESSGERREQHKSMGADHVITDRKTLREDPPDILLTNYKMLDYLLVRPKDQRLWRHNKGEPLRFLVVDELHTFDGAQGTDLACLIRRLKHRLGVSEGRLCCVGTSATLGGADAGARLREYASDIFGEPFGEDAVVTEHRLGVGEFLTGTRPEFFDVPGPRDAATLDPTRFARPIDWIVAQQDLWFAAPLSGKPGTDAWRVALGEQLRRHALLQTLLDQLSAGPRTLDALVAEMARGTRAFRDVALARAALTSFVGLISEARTWLVERPEAKKRREAAGEPPRTRPFLDVRVQLWQRELTRMVATVEARPALRFSDDLTEEQLNRHLPLVHCRECGAMGWGTLQLRDKPDLFRTGVQRFYTAWFGADPMVRLLWPGAAAPPSDPRWRGALRVRLDSETLIRVRDGDEADPDRVVEIAVSESTRTVDGEMQLVRDCPFCSARGSLTLVGFRAATLTSVFVDQLFSSRFNDDKKLLAFSDSVQDAAHRAGFLGARTWRQVLRLALQQVVRNGGGDGLPLSQVPTAFTTYWRGQRGLDALSYASLFLPPNMEWMQEVDRMRENESLADNHPFLRMIEGRVAYEIATEYGHQSRIGRSLGRTGCSTVLLDPARLDVATEALLEPLRNEVAGLRELDAQRLRGFLVGALHRLRERGGVDHPEMPREYLETAGKDTHAFKRVPYLPALGPGGRHPTFWVEGSHGLRFEPMLEKAGGNAWPDRWVRRCFGPVAPLIGEPRDVWALVVPALVKAGLLSEVDAKGFRVWGLRWDALQVSGAVRRLRCTRCRHWMVVADGERERWDYVPCLTADCEGAYQDDADGGNDYYRRLIDTGDVERVVAAEHTGLLARPERERVETWFKAPAAERRPWYPNLLSSTPTLEMGIDIGDLSTGILCSVPPAQANYLQRVGRAGRRDGNALVLTLALGRPHDLYFYAEPEEMIAGRVDPPGVFLNASAVLERQLAAFCFDRWNATGVSADAVPATLKEVFPNLEDEGRHRFPHNWLAFVHDNQEELFSAFVALFGDRLAPESRVHLRAFLMGDRGQEGSLAWKVLDVLLGERKQRDALNDQREKIRKRLAELKGARAKDKNHDSVVKALRLELEALGSLIRSIEATQTLQFLTDQGLLPNYAFPESPIRLRSVIWRRKTEAADGEPKYEVKTFEYVRPALSAIAELAPENRFYAGGRQVEIEQVDVETAKIETWRFCDRCSYSVRIDRGDPYKDCPACGSPAWGEESQRRPLLQLRQVFANTSDRESRIRDDLEERQPKFYNRNVLVAFRKEDRDGAWRINADDVPFAFEYIRRASFREVNFGHHSEEGTKFSIAGRSEVRDGFRICKDCGKVQSKPKKKREGEEPEPAKHALWCPSRKKGADADFERAVYLYRESHSEAVRMLLPLAEIGTQRQLNSFLAAFQLGLRDRYGGKVDHLRTVLASEPEQDGLLRRQYLVLYDTVPGGTGYLKDLTRERPDQPRSAHPMLEIIERAYRRLTTCVCVADDERDGCYRCLFAYRNSRDMAETSRRTAADLFARILAQRERLVPVDSLSDVSVSGLMDSALEARFIEALSRAKVGGQVVRVEKALIKNKPGFRVTVAGRTWNVEQQRELGPAQGMDPPVSIDFVFHPDHRDVGQKPIAVFLDGLAFHEARVGRDMLQRMSLLTRGEHDVWTLSWWDVDAAFHNDVKPPPPLMHPDPAALATALRGAKQPAAARYVGTSAFDRFLGDLAGGEHAVDWSNLAPLAMVNQMMGARPIGRREWLTGLEAFAPVHAVFPFEDTEEEWMRLARPPGTPHPAFGLWATLSRRTWKDARVLVWLDDRPAARTEPGFRDVWNAYLHTFQALRTLPNAWFVTATSVETLDYTGLAEARSITGRVATPVWPGVIDEVQAAFVPLVSLLEARGLPRPVVGLDLPDARGRSSGLEGELVWEEARVAVLLEAGKAAAVDPGWQLFVLEALQADVQPLIDALALTTQT